MNIRKYFLLLLALISLFAMPLFGCTNNDIYIEEDSGASSTLNIVTTIFPPYDFARQITGGRAEVSMLLPPGAESHSYEPSPRDIIKIQNSDIFIFTGGESDMWIEDILESMDTKDMKIIRLMECVNSLEEELSEGMVGHEIHNHEKEYDEHVWTSPENAIVITNKISEVIRELDSENSEYYEENTKRYVGELAALSQEFRDVVKEGSRNVVVFGDRFPFRYFTEEYGLEYFAAFPGCSSETEPSVSTLVFLIDMVKKEDIPVIFYLEASNRKTAEMISEATGAKTLLFHSCHSLYQKELDEGRTYLDLMKQNAENLREALQ